MKERSTFERLSQKLERFENDILGVSHRPEVSKFSKSEREKLLEAFDSIAFVEELKQEIFQIISNGELLVKDIIEKRLVKILFNIARFERDTENQGIYDKSVVILEDVRNARVKKTNVLTKVAHELQFSILNGLILKEVNYNLIYMNNSGVDQVEVEEQSEINLSWASDLKSRDKAGVYFATGKIEELESKGKTIPEIILQIGNKSFGNYIRASNFKRLSKDHYKNAFYTEEQTKYIIELCKKNQTTLSNSFIIYLQNQYPKILETIEKPNQHQKSPN